MANSNRGFPEIVPSLLDRLLDDHPEASQEPISSWFQNVREMRAAVARDLESLLNTRQEALDEVPAEFEEVSRSLLVYGLPDFTAFNLLNPTDLGRLRHAIENTIANFEPRLQRVRVTMEPPRENERAVRFRTEALMRVDPGTEPVAFDTVLQLGTQQYQVKGQD